MSNTVPPAVPPAAPLRDVAHPAAAPVVPPVPPVAAPVAPVIPLRDVTHAPAAPEQQYGPASLSEPLPIPRPMGITRSQLTAEPQQVTEKPSMIAGIAPETALYKPEPQKKAAPVASAAPAPVAAPVATVEVHEASPIAGGPVSAPLVPLPQGTPTAAVDTPFAVADSVRKFAESHGIDLGTVTPTGKGGRIVKKDIESAIAARALADAAADAPEAGDEAQAVVAPTAEETTAVVIEPALVFDDEQRDQPLTVAVHMLPEAAAEPTLAAVADMAPAPAPKPVAATPAPAVPAVAATTVPAPAPVASPAPAAPAPAADPVPSAPAATPAPSETLTVRVHLTIHEGQTLQFGSNEDLLNLAAAKLPPFRVTGAVFEYTTAGPVLIATVDPNVEVSL